MCIFSFSEKLQKFYIGTTDDVDKRLLEHNTGKYKTAFSVKGMPWTLFMNISCRSSKQAYKLEAFIKRMKSASFIRRLKSNPEIISSVLEKIQE
ncbi:GIY-YIG nuclease family protein [Nostoc ellipsosporum NOK]|nr:GIY-YIG nuclease family protein [Nostoc ellipsosporum NOK]